jgi:hypothetical protein|tara:strand:+ start:171 stop:596 length:426 start_codon:yes stop_codon:yes gene_type:complete
MVEEEDLQHQELTPVVQEDQAVEQQVHIQVEDLLPQVQEEQEILLQLLQHKDLMLEQLMDTEQLHPLLTEDQLVVEEGQQLFLVMLLVVTQQAEQVQQQRFQHLQQLTLAEEVAEELPLVLQQERQVVLVAAVQVHQLVQA